MTYAGYAMLCEKVPEKDIWNEETLILCDELQNAILWSCFQSENNIHKKALYLIKKKINSGNIIVVAISATPSIIKESFYRINEIPLLGTPRHYENEEIIKYNDIMLLINKLTPDKKGIIYISQISQIKKCQKILDDKGFRTSAIWSINNPEYPLTSEQKRVRDYIIENSEIPPYIDVLFVNKSAETSISLGNDKKTANPIDYMIVHTSYKDAQIQVRGRYRNDLKTLYLHDDTIQDKITIDEKWLNFPLNKAEKDQLCIELNLYENGRLLKWPSLKAILEYSGYAIKEHRTTTDRFSIINV